MKRYVPAAIKAVFFLVCVMLGSWIAETTSSGVLKTNTVAVTHDQRVNALVCRSMLYVHYRSWELACAMAVGKDGGKLEDAEKKCLSAQVEQECENGLIPPDADEQDQINRRNHHG